MPKPITWNLAWLIISKQMKHYLLISLVLLLASCKKPTQRACFKSTGTMQHSIQTLANFKYVHVGPYLEVEFMQDSLAYVEWEAGRNLTTFLLAEVHADTLVLENNNKCRFLRYANGKVKATVHFTSIEELHLANSEKVSTITPWTQEKLLVYLHEGVGQVDLQLAVQNATIRNNYGWQELLLKGTAASLFVDFDGSAALDAKHLHVSDSITYRSSSLLPSYLLADQLLLKAQLYGSGNLYYTGQPSLLLKTEYGQGKVLQQ